MGLTATIRRWRYVYGWRLRYWWLDTRSGERAQVVCWIAAAVLCVAEIIRVVFAAMPAAHAQQHAIWWWVVQLIIALISAAVSYALRPKPKDPKPQTGESPNTDDGQTVKHHFGEVWVDDSFILAWKMFPPIPIKSSGGK